MIYPSVQELSDKGVNRYMLSIATAKCARRITDEQLERARENQEQQNDRYSSGFSSKKQPNMEKPVKEAIIRLYSRDYKIIPPAEDSKD
ncbi:MAG: DNA-directed RNA polymerase subunit omega [Clostridia bacterium]|nr:DNA-directed RNA polymerase subunit omega [Clostridia bacterium]